ncbi:MAG TPA: hypothetical protein VMT27_01900 [Actinomycetes bacterium]|nr:hypothetical protein [Actinomycetes bacterium]
MGNISEPASEATPVESAAEPAGEQSEFDLGVVSTGNPAVDAALAGLDGLADRAIGEHPDVFEGVHQVLSETLVDLGQDGLVDS